MIDDIDKDGNDVWGREDSIHKDVTKSEKLCQRDSIAVRNLCVCKKLCNKGELNIYFEAGRKLSG